MDPLTSTGASGESHGRRRAAMSNDVGPDQAAEAARSVGLHDVEGLVWGPRQEVGDRVVIPVARVASGGQVQRWRGAVAVEPLGALEISPQGTRFVPVVSVNRIIATVFAAVLGIVGLVTFARLLTSRRGRSEPASPSRSATAPQGNSVRFLSPALTFAPEFSPKLEIEDVSVASPSFREAFKR